MDAGTTGVLDEGTRLGEYEVKRLLGVGSMGAVYECVHPEISKRFAIKVLNPALASVPAARARFLREARLTARVRHPHIVSVIDVGEDGGRCFLVMDLLEGEDLAHRLQRDHVLPAAEAAAILWPVCDAVAEAHRRGVTHRDLKPSNIFLTTRDGRPYPIVLDFGIATEEGGAPGEGVKASDADGAAPAVFGTPYYLAPEQIRDHRAAGPASDQYALGVILYECLTGEVPFRGENLDEVFRAITAGNPAPPSARRADVPREIDAVVLRALNRDMKARFAWVVALRRALEPFAAKFTGTSLEARRTSTPAAASPAIAAEASTPTPFVRTLTPEVQATSGSWFEAPEVTGEFSGPTKIPTARAVDEIANASGPVRIADEPGPAAVVPFARSPSSMAMTAVVVRRDGEDEERAPRDHASRRFWVIAAAGVTVCGLVLALVATGGSSSSVKPPPAAAVVVAPSEPPPAKPAAEAVVVAPAAAEVPAAAPAPAVATPDPVPAPDPTPAPAPGAAATPPPARARRVEPVEPSEPAAAAPPEEAAPPKARKPADKPRTRSSGGIRMHNGVPLLD